MNGSPFIRGARLRALPSIFACLLLVHAVPALPDDKKHGYDDENTGVGVPFSAEEAQKIRDTLAKLRGFNVKIKTGKQVRGDSIADDLGGMLEDGRMGKGSGAKRRVNGSTRRDGKSTTEGDRINISDHFIHRGWVSNKVLASVLAHEWAHAKQADGPTKPEREAEAYQIEDEIYLAKGGRIGDPRDDAIQDRIDEFKEQIAGDQQLLPDSNTPARGTAVERGSFGNEYYLWGHPGELSIVWNDSVTATLAPLPLHTFFTQRLIPRPGTDDLLIVFGADTSLAGDPVGVITAVGADSMSFESRVELPLALIRHPFGVTLDPATGVWYVLDTHDAGQGISVVLDSNGDQVPDFVEPEPFASRAFPGVAEAQYIEFAKHPTLGGGLLVYDYDARGTDDTGNPDPVEFLVDQDGDRVADQLFLLPEVDFVRFAPGFAALPRSGDTSLEVAGMPGHLIQVWATDSTGDVRTELLGSANAGLTATPIALGRPLVFGEHVLPVDATASTRPVIATAVQAPPVPALAPWHAAALILILAVAAARRLVRRGASGWA